MLGISMSSVMRWDIFYKSDFDKNPTSPHQTTLSINDLSFVSTGGGVKCLIT